MKIGQNGWSRNGVMPALKKNWCPCCGGYKGSNHRQENLMKLDLPLVQFCEENFRTKEGDLKSVGRRTGYLLRVLEIKGVALALVQPLGPAGTVPEPIQMKIDEVWMVDKSGTPTGEPLSVPASAGEVETKLKKERIITMATKKAKKAGSEAKTAKTHNVTYFNLTEKAPATKDLKEGSHAYAVAAALRNFKGRCERSKLSDYIVSEKLIGKESEMDPKKAINWMVSQFKTKGFIKAEVVEEAL